MPGTKSVIGRGGRHEEKIWSLGHPEIKGRMASRLIGRVRSCLDHGDAVQLILAGPGKRDSLHFTIKKGTPPSSKLSSSVRRDSRLIYPGNTNRGKRGCVPPLARAVHDPDGITAPGKVSFGAQSSDSKSGSAGTPLA